MAIYSCSVKTISRSNGHSATAAAAYQAGIKLYDETTGETHNYANKSGVVKSKIIVPEGSPEWAKNPERLFTEAEKSENRKNSTVAREFIIALPHELDKDQQTRLSKDITQKLVDRFGFAAQYSIHKPSKKGDQRNDHIHILATTREMTPDGLGKKTRELDGRANAINEVRGMVGKTINKHLKHANVAARVDHRSLKDQQEAALEKGQVVKAAKLARKPQIHVGKPFNGRGYEERQAKNAKIIQYNTDFIRKQQESFAKIDKTISAKAGKKTTVAKPSGHSAKPARSEKPSRDNKGRILDKHHKLQNEINQAQEERLRAEEKGRLENEQASQKFWASFKNWLTEPLDKPQQQEQTPKPKLEAQQKKKPSKKPVDPLKDAEYKPIYPLKQPEKKKPEEEKQPEPTEPRWRDLPDMGNREQAPKKKAPNISERIRRKKYRGTVLSPSNNNKRPRL